MEDLISSLANLVKFFNPEYSIFKENKTVDLLINKYRQLEEFKELYKIRNFPLKSADEFLLSIRCIINNKVISKPARTYKCSHVEVMELVNLFKYVLKYGKCPLCESGGNLMNNKQSEKIDLNSIYIDEVLQTIFTFENRECEFIIINKNTRQWRPFDPRGQNNFENLNTEEHLRDLHMLTEFIGREDNQITISRLVSGCEKINNY